MSFELTRTLEDVWDDGNAVGLDGWIGPGRGAGEVDSEALRCRERAAQKACEVILAAGYRKPRVVTTLEELKTVYEGSILKDAEGEMWGIDGSTGRLFLVGDGNYDLYDDDDLHLPATVVYEEPEPRA